MQLYRILLCDSDLEQLRSFEAVTQEYFERYAQDYTLFKFGSGEDLRNYLYTAGGESDILMLSCRLADMDGVALAAELKETNRDTLVVLYGDGVDGRVEDLFEARASYYLYTPTTVERIQRCMETITEELQKKNESYLELRNKKGVTVIDKEDIYYVLSDRRKICIYIEGGSYEFYMKLDEIGEMLGGNFLRCHQSYLVNMKKIVQITGTDLLLTDGTRVPISEKRYYATKKEYLNYVKTII